ncbi:MAG: hypothetical protein H0U50_06195 [Pyrinomonadaceae bacterium]|nr:hypothetical protein [Pyrinomonadaceae bacterium]
MINKSKKSKKSKSSKKLRILNLSFALAAFVLISGHFAAVNAQRGDPFEKPSWAKPKTNNPGARTTGGQSVVKPVKAGPPPVVVVTAPDINQRINYYKQMRLEAAENGQPIPKPTTVLTLDELSVTGIFRTPRGYAAMVEAKPISLSYPIYPGEKFFDGQLVAIEDNRLVFRKVTKMSNGKFIASVENKALRQYSVQEQIRGTAPIESVEKPAETASNTPPAPTEAKSVPTENKSVLVISPAVIVSPLDEMSRQPEEKPKVTEKEKSAEKGKSAKKGKKPVKLAKNK